MKRFFALCALLLSLNSANAYTECQGTLSSVYQDNGIITANMTSGAQIYVPSTEAMANRYMATMELALTAGKAVRIRLTADGINCNTYQIITGVMGFYIYP